MNRSNLKPLRLYLLIAPTNQGISRDVAPATCELTAFLRGLNQAGGYEVEIYTLTSPSSGLSAEQFPIITLGTKLLSTGLYPSSDELSSLLRLGCESTDEVSHCCSEVQPLREQAAELQTQNPGLADALYRTSTAASAGKPGVLFVCCHNSCRSQMAEAFFRRAAGNRFDVQSCGLTVRPILPETFSVMKEAGMELAGHLSKDWTAVTGRGYIRHVIFVCDVEEKDCPRFIPFALNYHRHHFDDPSEVEGSPEKKLAAFRQVRDEIKAFTETIAETLK